MSGHLWDDPTDVGKRDSGGVPSTCTPGAVTCDATSGMRRLCNEGGTGTNLVAREAGYLCVGMTCRMQTCVPNSRSCKPGHRARLKAQASTPLPPSRRAAIAGVKACRSSIDGDYDSMGVAVKAPKKKGVAQALGRADFAEVCVRDLGMSVTRAAKLVTLVTRLTRATVQLLGRVRASAMITLVDATPADDSVAEILTATLRLPSGRRLVVADASTESVWAAANEFRLAAAVSVELKSTRKAHGAEVAVRMPLALWATLAPSPR